MNIIVRKAEPEDYLAVQAIHAMPKVYSGTLQLPLPSKDMWKKRLSTFPDHVHFFVAEADGNVVGFSGLDLQQNVRRRHVALLWISVHDDWHNQGIGAKLMHSMLDAADQWLGILRLELTVFVDNRFAIALYEKFGFKQEGILEKYAFRNGSYQDVVSMARIHPTLLGG